MFVRHGDLTKRGVSQAGQSMQPHSITLGDWVPTTNVNFDQVQVLQHTEDTEVHRQFTHAIMIAGKHLQRRHLRTP